MTTQDAVALLRGGTYGLDVQASGPGNADFRVLVPSLASALGYGSPTQLLRLTRPGEIGKTTVETAGGTQKVNYITGRGFIRIVNARQLDRIADQEVRESVRRFQEWALEVIYTVMTRGAYATDKLSDDIASVLLEQDVRTDQALVAIDQGRPAEAATRLRQARDGQAKLNELIDREPLPITRGVADRIRTPEIRKALGLGKHDPKAAAADYSDDAVIERRTYRYPAQYAR